MNSCQEKQKRDKKKWLIITRKKELSTNTCEKSK